VHKLFSRFINDVRLKCLLIIKYEAVRDQYACNARPKDKPQSTESQLDNENCPIVIKFGYINYKIKQPQNGKHNFIELLILYFRLITLGVIIVVLSSIA